MKFWWLFHEFRSASAESIESNLLLFTKEYFFITFLATKNKIERYSI